MNDLERVKQAAERKLAWLQLCKDSFPSGHPSHNYIGDLGQLEEQDDEMLARFALAEIGSDGEEPVSEDWLRSIGFLEVFASEVPDYISLDEHGELRMKLWRRGNFFCCEVPEWPDDIHVKKQVISLMSALGIEPKATTNTGATS